MSNWNYDPSAWVNGATIPQLSDFQAIATDLHTRGGNVDGGGWGRVNTAFLTFTPGALPGTQYNVTAASWTGYVATLTIGGHSIKVNQIVGVSGITPSGYNVTATVTAVTGTTISFALGSNPGAYVSGGLVLVGAVTPGYGTVAVDGNLNVQVWNGSSYVAATTAIAAGVWHAGAGVPSAGMGSNGDMYVDTATGNAYGPKTAGAWGAVALNIKGPIGATGSTGLTGSTGYAPQFLHGAGAPSSGTGNNGDIYIDTATQNIYGPKTAGAWGAIVTNILGATGGTGPTGYSAVWQSGAGVPSSGTGNDGDMYLDSATGNVYGPKAAGAWGAIVKNLVGPPGTGMTDPGSNGIMKRTSLNVSGVAGLSDVMALLNTGGLYNDVNGNWGIGGALAAWHSGFAALQAGNAALFSSTTGSSYSLAQNAYYDATGAWKYLTSVQATRIDSINGTHVFNVAASGTAGAAITWTAALTIDNNANVGIGGTPATTYSTGFHALVLGPTVTAQWSGGLNFLLSQNVYTGAAGAWYYQTSAAGCMYQQSNGAHVFWTFPAGTAGATGTPATSFSVDANSNAGIGGFPLTTWATGQNVLQIGGNASLMADTGTGAGKYLQISQNAYYTNPNWLYISTAAAANYYQGAGQHVFRVAASGTAGTALTWTTAATIDNAGRLLLGLNTAYITIGSPLLQIQASQATNNVGAYFKNTSNASGAYTCMYLSNDNDAYCGLLRNSSTNTGYAGAGALSMFSQGANPIGFITGNTVRMAITSNGTVVVGNFMTAPAGYAFVVHVGTNQNFFVNSNGTNACFGGGNDAGSANTPVELHTSGVSIVNGSSLTPAYLLHLAADSAGKPSTNTWTISSDARVKNVLRPFQDGLECLLALRPVWYQYNGKGNMPDDAKDGKLNIGVVAQEAQPHVPYCVESHRGKLEETDAEETDILTFNSHALTWVTVNALQQVAAKLAAIEARMAAVESRN
jgi:hypothetical protein